MREPAKCGTLRVSSIINKGDLPVVYRFVFLYIASKVAEDLVSIPLFGVIPPSSLNNKS